MEDVTNSIVKMRKMKKNIQVVIEKLNLVREYYLYYKSHAIAFDNAFCNFVEEQNKRASSDQER